jgi:caffeoyl-CoA O-methyltransferase
MARSSFLSDTVSQYLLNCVADESAVLRELRDETQKHKFPGMQIAADQGSFMALLVELVGVKRSLEVGVYTGYSSIVVASAMPENGQLVACDISKEWTDVAQRYWRKAGVSSKIELRLGPALETLEALLRDGARGTFDFAFIDADKASYDGYYEASLELLRQGGLVAVDNALWGGSVADPARDDEDTNAIRALNAKAHSDPRVTASLVPVGDGLLLARKR